MGFGGELPDGHVGKRAKYVKFFVGNYGDEASLKLLDLTITIYDKSSNYHKRYFGNQASVIDWTQPS